jgi:hypothetical protein
MADKFNAEELRNMLSDGAQDTYEKNSLLSTDAPREINPPNKIKQKVGSGGLADSVIVKAQKAVQNSNTDFRPTGMEQLEQIKDTYKMCSKKHDEHADTDLINMMIAPAMQMKSNGGMFGYDLITTVSDLFVQFLEAHETIDKDFLEVVGGFIAALNVILASNMKGSGDQAGAALVKELNAAWTRLDKKKKA